MLVAKSFVIVIAITVLCPALASTQSGMSIGSNSGIGSKKNQSEIELFEQIRVWLDKIKTTGVPEYCTGLEEEIVTNDEMLVRHALCHEAGAIKRSV
jgi:hypothetical protein